MNILIVGLGAREHALAWKILQSPKLTQLYLTTRNGSIASLEQYTNKPILIVNINETAQAELIRFAQEKAIDLVVIGGEAPLAAGLSDAFHTAHIKVFAPSQAAAQIECSKIFAKDFMVRHNIPTARYAKFNQFFAAINYIKTIDYPIVIKASGLASGKGVFLPNSAHEAEIVLHDLLLDHTLGSAGDEVIIEERLIGEEVSLLAFSDGIHVKPMPPARDHKRLLDNDIGPNTGGMGAYAPVPLPKDMTSEFLTQTILQPTIEGLHRENMPFTGVIYAGLMLTAKGPRVLEFNCRFGDPEAEILLPLLDSDLLDIMQACTENKLEKCDIHWKKQAAACVVLAANGYPEQSKTGDEIQINNTYADDSTIIFHAGTRLDDKKLVTAGGRVLVVTAWDDEIKSALTKAYNQIRYIHFKDMHYRKDIGENFLHSINNN